jgi:hypothetical protein
VADQKPPDGSRSGGYDEEASIVGLLRDEAPCVAHIVLYAIGNSIFSMVGHWDSPERIIAAVQSNFDH